MTVVPSARVSIADNLERTIEKVKSHSSKKVSRQTRWTRRRFWTLLLAAVVCSPWAVRAASEPVQIVKLSTKQTLKLKRSSPLVRSLVTSAEKAIGTPYVWGGTDLSKGIDCSNFTWKLYRKSGQTYPRYLGTQYLSRIHRHSHLQRVTFAEARPGDLLVYGYSDRKGWHGHVVILIDKDGKASGVKGLTLGAHGGRIQSVQYITYQGFDTGYFKHPKMRLVNVLRPSQP